MKGLYATVCAFLILIPAQSPAQDADIAAGAREYMIACAGCHGVDGNSANPEWPKLAGQGEKYLVKQLQEFKSGKRDNALMAAQAMPLSDQDMQDLAAYFAGQTQSQGAADESLVELGEKIYRGGNPTSGVAACIGCHGPAGKGNPAALFPALSGQHAKYVETQLHAFKAGERDNDAAKMMRNTASSMTEQEIKAVASYIQGLH